MFKRLYQRFTSLIQYRNTHRKLKFRRNDVFIVSYPKSGNTWMRFLLGNLILGDDGAMNFGNFNTIIPDIYRTPKDSINQMKGQRFIKSHEHFNTAYPKVIYIQRNPKKIVTSYYTWYRNKNPGLKISFDDFFNNFINGLVWKGSWKSHTSNWIKGSILKPDRIHVLKYEDLISDTPHELKKILNFLNLSFSEKEIKTAIKKSSVEQMKKDEEKYPHAIFENSAGGFVKNNRYKEKLTSEHEAAIEKAFGIY